MRPRLAPPRLFSWSFCVALLGCAGPAPLPPKAVEMNQMGVEALLDGDLETADARLSLALEYHPRYVDALVNLGLVELQRGNFARARLLFAKARRINEDLAQPHHAFGVLAEREGKPREALKHYRAALAVDPGFAPARANYARVLFEQGFIEESLLSHRRLVQVAPQEPSGHVGLVECLVRLERYTEADAALATARMLFVGEGRLELLEARRLLRGGAADRADELLAPLAEGRHELTATATAWRAVAALACGDRARARSFADRALSLEPREPVAERVLAELR